MADTHLLEVRNLSVRFHIATGVVNAVKNISWHLDRGETLAILGESGSGKSVSAAAIMNLLDTPPAEIVSGEVLFDGRDLLKMPPAERRAVNGRRIAMIFQDPLSHLNPVYTVGWQLREVMRVHGTAAAEAATRALDLMRRVGIPDPEQSMDKYPHQFSGGQRQRINIARALATRPDLVVCDEPVSALDVAIRAQILNLLARLQRELGLTYLFISHDMAVVEHLCDEIAVMYLGQIVERAPRAAFFAEPLHPYSVALMSAVPTVKGGRARAAKRIRLSGDPPSPISPPPGCRFAGRCPVAEPACGVELPPLREVAPRHWVRCRRVEVIDGRARPILDPQSA